ncbi:PadR family transcriptional regulator [uncultured Brevundimonas sp.]|uniref:PadR family transcriptional regulator n=1 Tax=uncultured Brevundimonas sp. TaxID=213418 RepID=UPI00261F8E4E|nr:PadR family transcriptional regulator [uncultured Brevundimonas sp.]
MSLPHALLTALIESPGSGLELAKRFDKSIGHFWQATHQQIYRELAKLEAEGLIASEAEAEARGRKRNYHVLPKGRALLESWLGEEEPVPPLRDTLMVKLRAEAVLDSTDGARALRARMQARLDQHRAKLEQYRQFETRDLAKGLNDRASQLRHMILKAGLRHEGGWVETLEEALALLDQPENT